MESKAQGLSLQVVVIAAISLIVLVVLISIFVGKSKTFNESTTFKCEDKDVNFARQNNCPSGTIKGKGVAEGVNGVDDGRVVSCCIPFGG